MQYSVRTRVLALSLVLHAWPHDTVPYHSSGMLYAALGREVVQQNSGRLLPGFHAVRHNTIPLRW
jgi:hypothetical protein